MVLQILHGWHGVCSNGMLSWKAMIKYDGDILYTNAIISVDLSSETVITTSMSSSITHINYPPDDFKNNYPLVYKEFWLSFVIGILIGMLTLTNEVSIYGYQVNMVLKIHGRSYSMRTSLSLKQSCFCFNTRSHTKQTSLQNCFEGNYNMKVFAYRKSLIPLKSQLAHICD